LNIEYTLVFQVNSIDGVLLFVAGEHLDNKCWYPHNILSNCCSDSFLSSVIITDLNFTVSMYTFKRSMTDIGNHTFGHTQTSQFSNWFSAIYQIMCQRQRKQSDIVSGGFPFDDLFIYFFCSACVGIDDDIFV
jgi:hypothetical protein